MVIVIVMVIGLITAIVLIALGLLAAYASIIVRRPDAPSYFDPVLYQGWLSCLCGIWVLFNGVLTLIALRYLWGANEKLAANVAAWVGLLEVVLGLLLGYLGYALLTKRGEQVREQARPIRLGYLAVVFSVLAVYPTLFLLFFPIGPVPVGPVPVQ